MNKNILCGLGLHKWEILAHGGQIASIEWKRCKLCGIVIKTTDCYGRTSKEIAINKNKIYNLLDDITQTEICPNCLSKNIYYCPQFSYSEKYKRDLVAGIRECLDCGDSGSVM